MRSDGKGVVGAQAAAQWRLECAWAEAIEEPRDRELHEATPAIAVQTERAWQLETHT